MQLTWRNRRQMKTQPGDLESTAIATALLRDWGLESESLHYAPLGFGSHHWIARMVDGSKWFVTVDDLSENGLGLTEDEAFEHLASPFRMASALRNMAGLPFVVGPHLLRNGDPIGRLNRQYSLAVFPFLNVEETEFGEFKDLSDRDEALRLVGRIHNATDDVAAAGLRRDSLDVPNREFLENSFETLDDSWEAGPYSEAARLLLREHLQGVRDRLNRFDALVGLVMADTTGWVVTHGEPHAGNVVRVRGGGMVIVDWDTAVIAPRERDLWMLVNESNPDWSAYRDVTGVRELSDETMMAYRLWWDLSEIAVYVLWCRTPHERTEEMAIAWESLQEYLSD
jgi:spectinomycin phosphotransferase